tara:strand:- start:25 stop:342 length:318 start_codon:yes stop_codon:yes gene_type:complete
MKKEIKFYKAEVDGSVYVRQSKNDYTVAMVVSGSGVVSFNSKELSKASVLKHLTPKKWLGGEWIKYVTEDGKIVDYKASYDSKTVYPVVVVQISKEEYNEIRKVV